ncbi:MAG TPA: hypothetical protein VK742_06895 [Candidatus Sulfotelmatobacter sp.]|jgi:hypothetical protein|nr:hypothetical protein [Candidatus Sulfotelmatobacter sp.]
MNRRPKKPQPRNKNPAYRPVFERLDAALEENTPHENSHKIRLLRLAMFGDVDALQKSGRINLPKQNYGSQSKICAFGPSRSRLCSGVCKIKRGSGEKQAVTIDRRGED